MRKHQSSGEDMQFDVKQKQPNSKMCFVCGIENSFGLKSRFYELENDELVALFTPDLQHQGYPGRLHGGIAAAILDETIGRAVMIKYSQNIWGVTVDFSMRFKKPIPLDEEIRVLARITKDSRKMFEGSGEIILADGTVAITATGKYLKMDINTITDADFEEEAWEIVEDERDPLKVALE
jgi:acyl-coenzyme A thioesterase PaaI-like protein